MRKTIRVVLVMSFGYPGLMITDTAFYRNPNYHLKKDTMETLDFKRMGQVIEGLYITAREY